MITLASSVLSGPYLTVTGTVHIAKYCGTRVQIHLAVDQSRNSCLFLNYLSTVRMRRHQNIH